MPTSPLEVFLALLLGHFLCDFALQSDAIALGKNPRLSPHKTVRWGWWMAGHCAPHAAAVWLVTGLWVLGAAEFAAHFAADWYKCRSTAPDLPDAEKVRLADVDQAFHVFCKMYWTLLWVLATGWLHAVTR